MIERASAIRAARSLRLIVISDVTRASSELVLARFAALARAAKSESVLFILRDYQLPLRARLSLGHELRRVARNHEQWFGVAERAELARVLGADAIHLPEHGLLESDARAYLGPSLFVSRACHEPARVCAVDADAVLLSPIAAERKGNPALGTAALERARQLLVSSAGAPRLFALGGVDESNAAACLAAGADGIAVVGAALAPNPLPLLSALQIQIA
ncbi:MAG TPA: thiamine phosphate synthase [Polyangiaceae bacterium]|jgi:thiamine-phosphate pyrophosphorylase|nr:thiamine phosphate synthase [Polyangiaceae bacterium]